MNKDISSSDIIDFLKQKKLYISDNNINNVINSVSNLHDNTSQSIIFIKKTRYDLDLIKSKVLIVAENFKESSTDKTIIFSKNPQLAMAHLIKMFFSPQNINTISKKASIHKSVKLGKNVQVGEYVQIAENCSIGDNTSIHPGCVVNRNTIIGKNVILNSGVKIGQEGFGYIKDLDGNFINFPHIGKVIINDDVEIGANSCVDVGALSNTIIGKNTKINNLCHIAHNVQIGKSCLIAAKVNISGSTSIEDYVYIGPSASIIDGVSIENNAVIGMGAIVRKDVQEGFTIVPFGSFEKKKYAKLMNFLNKILKQKR
jgi:UDP-3-O-[3-hydroxymyristoyl] glucosamine N-acyltransferase